METRGDRARGGGEERGPRRNEGESGRGTRSGGGDAATGSVAGRRRAAARDDRETAEDRRGRGGPVRGERVFVLARRGRGGPRGPPPPRRGGGAGASARGRGGGGGGRGPTARRSREARTQRLGVDELPAHRAHALDDPVHRGRLLRGDGMDQHLRGLPRERQRRVRRVPALELRHEVVERDVDARVPVAPHRAARAGWPHARAERVRARRREAAGGRARGETKNHAAEGRRSRASPRRHRV